MKNKKITHGGRSPHDDIRNPECFRMVYYACFIRRKTQIKLPTRFGIERRSTFSGGRRNIPDYQIVYEIIRGKRFISRFAPG
jgi:hypothetical protein